MTNHEIKPLNWTPEPGVGYQVTRRPDGGMSFTFTDASANTMLHWRQFALEHLLDSDRLTTNLYDLRAIDYLPTEVVDYAVEVNNDPSVRNIRLAVVVSTPAVREVIEEISALTGAQGVEMAIFTDLNEAEAWLNRPLTLRI